MNNIEIEDLPINKRRIIIVASTETEKSLTQKINWKKFIPLYDEFESLQNFLNDEKVQEMSAKRKNWKHYMWGFDYEESPVYKILYNKPNPFSSYKTRKEIPFPIFNFEQAEKFNFPPQHPADGVVYACSDTEPDLYVPLSIFHTYMYQRKLSAFNEMCVSLGAKNCRVEYVEENGKTLKIHSTLDKVPTQFGNGDTTISFDQTETKNENLNIFFSLPKPEKIEKFETAWIKGEPTWETLQKIRLERDVSIYNAELSYVDEMGVTLKTASHLGGIGFNIGGEFENIVKRKFKFVVEFWPKTDT